MAIYLTSSCPVQGFFMPLGDVTYNRCYLPPYHTDSACTPATHSTIAFLHFVALPFSTIIDQLAPVIF